MHPRTVGVFLFLGARFNSIVKSSEAGGDGDGGGGGGGRDLRNHP